MRKQRLNRLSRDLVKKSRDAFMLALELYNKPTINYRVESFSILFSNSWELLLKAYIFQKNKGKKLSIYRKKERNKKRESISLDDCLNKVFENINNPVRRNIEYISEIRNEASHLIINELDPYFSRVFQPGVINYVKYLKDWFGIDINENLNPGLISLISDKDKISDLTILKGKYNKEDLGSIYAWIDKFNQLSHLGNQAAMSINYTIAIVKNSKKADFVISTGKDGNNEAVIIEKTKNPDITHPFNQRLAVVEVKKRIPKGMKFSTYDFQSFVFVNGYRKSDNNDFYFKGKLAGISQYSQQVIDQLAEGINKDVNNLKRWRKQYKQHLNDKRN